MDARLNHQAAGKLVVPSSRCPWSRRSSPRSSSAAGSMIGSLAMPHSRDGARLRTRACKSLGEVRRRQMMPRGRRRPSLAGWEGRRDDSKLRAGRKVSVRPENHSPCFASGERAPLTERSPSAEGSVATPETAYFGAAGFGGVGQLTAPGGQLWRDVLVLDPVSPVGAF